MTALSGDSPVVDHPLIGDSRMFLVDGMVRLFDSVAQGGQGPVWVSLEAPSGWGKTRVVREFYRRLARSRQYEGRYWSPDLASPGVDELDDQRSAQQRILTARKRIRPDLDRDGGSLPCWYWWAVHPTAVGGSGSTALAHDLEQIEQHKVFLLARCRTLTGSWRERHRSSTRELADIAVDEAAGELQSAMLEAVGAAVPGAGFVLAALGWTAGRAQARRAERALIGSATRPAGVNTDIADDAAATLGSIARPQLPVIVVVEDLHHADAVLVDLLDQLLASGRPLMVITATFPGRLDQHPGLNRLQHRHSDHLIRIRHHHPLQHPLIPDGAGLQALSTDELGIVLRQHQPTVTTRAQDLLVARYPNPLQLELYSTMRSTQHRVAVSGRLDLDDADVLDLPAADLESMYEAMWAELPESLRAVLVDACYCSPRTPITSADLVSEERWEQSLLDVAVLQRDGSETDEIDSALVRSGWVRPVGPVFREYSEYSYRSAASRHAAEYLTASDARATRKSLADHLRDAPPDPDTSDEQRAHRAALVVGMHIDGVIDDVDRLAASCLELAESLSAFPREAGRIRGLCEYALRQLPALPDVSSAFFGLRVQLGRALFECGLIGEAVFTYDALSRDIVDASNANANDPGLLRIRGEAANAHGHAGDVAGATAQLEALFTEQLAVLGPNAPDLLITFHNLLSNLVHAGHALEAAEQFPVLIEHLAGAFGDDHPTVLLARSNLAGALLYGGRAAEAVTEFEAIVADRTRVLGPDHQHVLIARRALARARGETGLHDVAAAQLRAVLLDHVRVLGADHPTTLIVRGDLAQQLLELGRLDDALAELLDLLEIRNGVLGEDHPDTLATRSDLALALNRAGRHTEAEQHLRGLIADQNRFLTVDHPHTLLARSSLGVVLWHAQRFDEALAVLQPVHADQIRVLGHLHGDTMSTRGSLGSALHSVGRTEEALEVLYELLNDRVRHLGREHPSTLLTIMKLIDAVGALERPLAADDPLRIFLIDEVVDDTAPVQSPTRAEPGSPDRSCDDRLPPSESPALPGGAS